VSGDMPTNQRSSQMREFAESKGLMTNARCLTEGVDLPAIDCVVFTDPKKSKVDIVQAAGRALRLSPGKKFGYILIPLIIPENENATEAAKDTAFEEIVATIRALATQDTRIIEYLRAVSSGTIPKGGSPVDGITKINVLTKVNEEEFNKSIQLKVWDRVAFGNWRPYEEAKKYAQSLKLKNQRQWSSHVKLINFPKDLPKAPQFTYKEWNGWGNFLGTGYVHEKIVRSYEEAKKYAQSLKLKNRKEWIKHAKSKNFPSDIPVHPWRKYRSQFEGLGIFLGTNVIAAHLRNYKSYAEAKKYLKKFKFKNENEFIKFTKSKNFPNDIPLYPRGVYKNEYEGMGIFLGLNKNSTMLRNFRSYEKAKKYAQSLNLTGQKNWLKHTKSKNFPKDIPVHPWSKYGKQFEGLDVFLGTKRFKSFYETRLYARKLNLKSCKHWSRYFKKNKRPKGIPYSPNRTYKKEWKSWSDFLGYKIDKNTKPRSKKS
jgi:superfamily II DNA/RNA helicase